jgi:ABC-type transport system involved in multi-copper enzyme maturation permease subunit
MKYLRIEYKKIIFSPFVWGVTALLFVLIIALYVGMLIKGVDISAVQFCTMALGNMSNAGMFQLAVIVAAAVSFAAEFSYGTFTYVRIRPVSMGTLIGSKILACLLFTLTVAGLIFLVSAGLGLLTWKAGPLTGEGGMVLTRPSLRVLLFYGCTVINQVFVISLTVMVSVMVRKHTAAMLVAYAVYVLMLIFVPESVDMLTPKAVLSMKSYLISTTIDFSGTVSATLVSLAYAVVVLAVSPMFVKKEA